MQTDTMTERQLIDLAIAGLAKKKITPGPSWLICRGPPYTTIWFRAPVLTEQDSANGNGDPHPHSVDLAHDGQVLRAN